MSTSINGWTVLNNPLYSDKRLVSRKVPGCRYRDLLMNKQVIPLFLAFAADYHSRFQPLNKRTMDLWSYVPKDGNASPGTPSDHFSGTAIDLNATREGAQGMGNYKWWAVPSRRNFVNEMLDKYGILMWGGSVDFGGSYTNGNDVDWMHWALQPGTTLNDVQETMERLRIDSRGYQNGRVAGL